MFFLRSSKNFGDQNWEKEKNQHEKRITVVSLSLSKIFNSIGSELMRSRAGV